MRDNTIRRFEFVNDLGEKWELEIDVANRTGVLTGDELDGERVLLQDNKLSGDLILSDAEFQWAAKCWSKAIGQELRASWQTLFNVIDESVNSSKTR